MTENNLPRPVTPKDEAFARPITRPTGSVARMANNGSFAICDLSDGEQYITCKNPVDLTEWR